MKKILLASAAIMALASNAQAVDRFPNWYLGLSGGAAFQDKSDWNNNTTKGTFDYDTGYIVSASLGYQPPSFGGFRIEGEISHHQNDLSGSGDDGDVKVDVAALNAYYDFRNDSRITPYVGAGLGLANFEVAGGNSAGADGKDSGAAVYQFLAGLGYETPTMPNVQWTAGYRYFAPFSDPKTDGGTKTEFEYDNHSVEVGAKFRF